jgi:hypothetical protein
VVGLVPAMQTPLLALLNGWSSGLLVDPPSEESRFETHRGGLAHRWL